MKSIIPHNLISMPFDLWSKHFHDKAQRKTKWNRVIASNSCSQSFYNVWSDRICPDHIKRHEMTALEKRTKAKCKTEKSAPFCRLLPIGPLLATQTPNETFLLRLKIEFYELHSGIKTPSPTSWCFIWSSTTDGRWACAMIFIGRFCLLMHMMRCVRACSKSMNLD